MRQVDPRLWNIVPAALLLTSACQTGPDIPVDGAETGTSDAETSGDGDTETSGDGDTETSGDGDTGDTGDECVPACGPTAYCLAGHCYETPPDPECNEDSDCPPGEICMRVGNDAECSLTELSNECGAPAVVEIPLPDEAQGEILDLEFVDLEGDGVDELVLLRAGELLVVSSDQTVASSAVDPLSEQLAAVRANDDEHLDLVLTSATLGHSGLLLGDGNGGFAAAGGLTIPPLSEAQAVDWPSGDAEELVALAPGGIPMLVSQIVAAPPTVEMFPSDSFTPADLHGVHAVDMNQDGEHEVVLRNRCLISYQGMTGEIADVGSWNSDVLCRSYVEPFGVDDEELLIAVAPYDSSTGLRLYSGYGTTEDTARIEGSINDLAGVSGLGLVLAGPTGTRMLTAVGKSVDCVSSFAELPSAERVIAGEFSPNPGEEFVLYGQGQLSLWARP